MKSTWTVHHYQGGFTTTDPMIGEFVKTNHYSKSLCRGTKHLFYILEGNKLIGVAAFGTPVGRNCRGKYSKTGKPILELKRLCLIDDTPKNSESWFIGNCLRHLKSTKMFDGILSYADPTKGHQGTIYKASNFIYFGKQKQGSTKLVIAGRKVSAASAKAKVSGKTNYVYDKPKHIFYYGFK